MSQQPTTDELWFVFQTVMQAAQAEATDQIGLITFGSTYDKDALRNLDYKRWHNKIGRAATNLFKAACEPLAAVGLFIFTMPDDVPTLEVTSDARTLYAQGGDIAAFDDYLNGNTAPVEAMPESVSADESSDAEFAGDADVADVGEQLLPVTSEESPDDLSDDSIAIDYSDDLQSTDIAGVTDTAPLSGNDRHPSDEDTSAPVNTSADFISAQTSSFAVDDPDDSLAADTDNDITQDFTPIDLNQTAGGGGDPFGKRSQGGGRQAMFSADVPDDIPSPKGRRSRRVNTDLDQWVQSAPAPGEEANSATGGSQPKSTPRPERNGQGDILSQGRAACADVSGDADKLSLGRSLVGRSTATDSTPQPSARPQHQRQTFGARVSPSDNDSADTQGQTRRSSRRIIPRNSDESELDTSARTTRRDGELPSASSDNSVSGASGPRRRVTQQTELLRAQGPRARAKVQAEALQPQGDEDVCIVPMPDGGECRFSKAVLDMLIEEHGSLTNVINWYVTLERQLDDEASD